MADLIAFPYDSLLSEGDSGLELDRAVDALFFRKMMRQYFTTGVFSPGFQVLASEKSIIVKKGSANINGVYAELEEDVAINITEYISSSTTVVLAVALRNDDTQSQRKTSVQIITDGTNNLVPPTRNATYYDIYIAKVTLDPNAITVYQSDITDLRLNNEYCGIVTATIQNVDTTTFYDQFQGALDRYLETVDSALDQTLAGNLQNQINECVKKIDIVDNLESTDIDKPLSANQGKLLNNKVENDVLLWNGSQTGYSINVTLNEEPFKYKWLIIDCLIDGKHVYAIAPIINHKEMSNAMSIYGYRTIFIIDISYTQNTKNLSFGIANWVDQNNNEPVEVVNIYGRY